MSPLEDLRAAARRRALRTAAAITLGWVSAASSGCEIATDAYCNVFPNTRMCCERAPGGHYDEPTGRCVYAPPPMGPLVPPSERA